MQKKLISFAAVMILAAIVAARHDSPVQAQNRKISVSRSRSKTGEKMEQRERYGEIKTRLRAAVKEVKELPDGYAFRYEPDPALLMAVAEFTTLERRCCPFFSFVLEVRSGEGPLWFRITGPKAAKPFIKDAFDC